MPHTTPAQPVKKKQNAQQPMACSKAQAESHVAALAAGDAAVDVMGAAAFARRLRLPGACASRGRI